MRYRYGPEDPEPWSAFEPPQRPGDRFADFPTNPDYAADPDYMTWLDEPADAARTRGLRHLSRLTFCAAQLSVAAAVGFAALFAHTAHIQAVSSPAPVRNGTLRTSPSSPAASPSSAGGSPSPAARPSPSRTPGPANSSGTTPAPARTLAPPATAPAAPPPSPAPVQTTTSGTTGG